MSESPKIPTVVLVHGGFADASFWGPVIKDLQAHDLPVRAPPNPLRGLAHDAEYIASYVNQIDGPVLLVAALNDGDHISEVLRAGSVVAGTALDLDLLVPAAEAAIVELDLQTVRFRHPLIRSAVRQSASVLRRRRVHEALAEALEAEPDRRIWHRAALITGARGATVAGRVVAGQVSNLTERRTTRCRLHLVQICSAAGFQPAIAYTTDDYVAAQSLVAAGLGVTTLPGLALAASRNPGVRAAPLPRSTRYVLAATYGQPPDPPATAALLAALTDTAARL